MEERGAVLCLVTRRAAVWSHTPTHARRRAYVSSGVIVVEVNGIAPLSSACATSGGCEQARHDPSRTELGLRSGMVRLVL